MSLAMDREHVYQRLLDDGPLTYDELGVETVPISLRERGIRRFRPTSNWGGSPESGGGQSRTIYYVAGDHDPTAVLEAWIQANQKTVKELSEWSLHQRIADYGDGFREASRDRLGPFHDGNPDQVHESKECPNCGEGGLKSVAEHLPECPAL